MLPFGILAHVMKPRHTLVSNFKSLIVAVFILGLIGRGHQAVADPTTALSSGEIAGSCYQILKSPSAPPLPFRTFESAIQEARADFDIRVLHKPINGQLKTVVLIAPKTNVNLTSARPLMSHFDHIGVTGNGVHSTWGGQINARLFHLSGQHFNFGLADMIKRLGIIRILGRIYGQYGQPDAVTVVDIENASLGRSLFSPQLQIIDLEKKHSPTLGENFESISSYISAALFTGFYFAAGHIPNWAQWFTDLAFTGANFYRYANHFIITSPQFKLRAWYHRYFPMGISIMNGRSVTMVKNIIRVLRGRQGAAKMLAIVPKNHIDGMVRLLEKQGYKQRPKL